MFKVLTGLLCLAVNVQLSKQATVRTTDPYYNAGVVEFRPSTVESSDERVLENLMDYLETIKSKEAAELDIIIFPESTLNNNNHPTFVPNPLEDRIVPCDAPEGVYHNILVQISCAARTVSKYVVINLTEKELCSAVPEDSRPCASSGLNIFNTNVVFDRSGAVISRYRKVHLYGENKNTTWVPEFGWFDTDFGVRFGHFICFDILFYSPAQEMVDKYGIKDFIFPSMWFSQLPFLTAVQVHLGWAYANDVNLLAAGSSNPSVGSTGSGIYNGRNGILIAKMNQGEGLRTLYTAKVPKHPTNPHPVAKRSTSPSIRIPSKPNIFLKRDYLENYESVLVDLSNGTSLSRHLCTANTSFCCTFDLKWQPISFGTESQHYFYRLGVYDALRNEEAAETNQLKNCAVFSCGSTDISDCGRLHEIDTDVVFENITINAKFPKAEKYLIMPNSLREADILPIPVENFEWSEVEVENQQISIRYSLNTTARNVLAFAIYGNYFDGDCSGKEQCIKDDNGDGAASMIVSVILVLLGFIIQRLL